MSSILGRAPVVDFDGTVARLDVPWAELREELGVTRVDELWDGAGTDAWTRVAQAERSAAEIAAPVPGMIDRLRDVEAFAILTSNATAAVTAFVRRFEALSSRIVAIVGREALGGPKTEFRRFMTGYARCLAATAAPRGTGAVVYAGDLDYELDFAAALGATALRVDPASGSVSPFLPSQSRDALRTDLGECAAQRAGDTRDVRGGQTGVHR